MTAHIDTTARVETQEPRSGHQSGREDTRSGMK